MNRQNAIDLALNGKQHEFIEIGFQEGGLCSMYGIKKENHLRNATLNLGVVYMQEQYCKRLKSLTRSVKGIRELTGCDDIYCSASEISAVPTGIACRPVFHRTISLLPHPPPPHPPC
ncbi:PREDICTED: uncharacterized protein LOC101297158 [Fragaria vesca subsp. vesca]